MELAKVFASHMVIQRNQRILIWGSGDGVAVVSFLGESVTASSQNGVWQIVLSSHPTGGPYTMTCNLDGNILELDDIYLGDVYLAAGQSNMAFTLKESEQKLEPSGIARIYTVKKGYENDFRPETDEQWLVCSDENAHGISAVGAQFACALSKEQNVPIGIISCNQGASCIESWIPEEVVEQSGLLMPITKRHDDASNYPFNGSGYLFCHMMKDIIPLPITAVLWYQGESNRKDSEANNYKNLLELMIRNWRTLWNRSDLPFFIVQLAAFDEDSCAAWQLIREQQLIAAQTISNVSMVTTGDCGELDQIHPKDKKTVAYRLSLCARNKIYGEKVEYCGPICTSMKAENGKMVLSFAHCNGNLTVKAPLNLQIAGEDGVFQNAEYAINGNQLLVWHQNISPYEVRLCFCNGAEMGLFNQEGLPASPFRIFR